MKSKQTTQWYDTQIPNYVNLRIIGRFKREREREIELRKRSSLRERLRWRPICRVREIETEKVIDFLTKKVVVFPKPPPALLPWEHLGLFLTFRNSNTWSLLIENYSSFFWFQGKGNDDVFHLKFFFGIITHNPSMV